MTRYWVTLGVLALAVGALWRAAFQFHIPLLEMAGTIGVFLLGLILSLALTRQQTLTGRKATENVLTALGPLFVVTDWAEGYGPAGAPDYVVASPAGIVCITLDTMSNAVKGRKLEARLARARERARQARQWVQERLPGAAPEAAAPLQAVLLLTRKMVAGGESQEDVPVLNPQHLQELFAQLIAPERLTGEQRIEITRQLRKVAGAAAGKGRR